MTHRRISAMTFTPPMQPPRWFKSPALGRVEERGDRLYFIPSAHPSLAGFGERHLGIEGQPGTAIALERAFRDANQARREYRQEKKLAAARALLGQAA
jgi:hypothetical protein